jgi:hypothetical protein
MSKFYTFLGIAIFLLSVLGAFFLWRYIPVYVGNKDAGFTATQALFAALGFVGLLGTLILQTISIHYGRKHQEKAIQNSERAIMLNAINVKSALNDSVIENLNKSIEIKQITKKQFSEPIFEDLKSKMDQLKAILDSSDNNIPENSHVQLAKLTETIASTLLMYMDQKAEIDDEIIQFNTNVTERQLQQLSDQVKISEIYNLIVADLKGEEAIMPKQFENAVKQIR